MRLRALAQRHSALAQVWCSVGARQLTARDRAHAAAGAMGRFVRLTHRTLKRRKPAPSLAEVTLLARHGGLGGPDIVDVLCNKAQPTGIKLWQTTAVNKASRHCAMPQSSGERALLERSGAPLLDGCPAGLTGSDRRTHAQCGDLLKNGATLKQNASEEKLAFPNTCGRLNPSNHRGRGAMGDEHKPRIAWNEVIKNAASIMRQYSTGVTLRQLFYRLVSHGILQNTSSAYKTLSRKTAAGRRAGTFPDLVDRTRRIHRELYFDGVNDALGKLSVWYRLDRTQGQGESLYLGVEKDGLVTLLEQWFGHLGLPVLALRGYSSQSYVQQIRKDVVRQGRRAVLIYGGDYDPSGEDIQRDFVERTGCFDEVVRVALTAGQVEEFGLPPMPGKPGDSRARSFIEKHGELVQVEIDALPPDTLRELFRETIEPRVDGHLLGLVQQREADGRRELRDILQQRERR